MKKILSIIIAFTLIFALFSCGCQEDSERFEDYYQMGLFYSIPRSFEQRNLSYGDCVYTDGEAYFFFNAFDEQNLVEDMHLSPEIPAKEYTELYILFLNMDVEYEYDEETMSTYFEYVYEYDDGVTPNEYYRHMISRNDTYVYQATVTCNEEDKDKYSDVFDKIMQSVRVNQIIIEE